MLFNTETLATFIGGQMEIQNKNVGYLFRGEIERAVVEDGVVKVRFVWLARNDGRPDRPSPEWTTDNDLDYVASLLIYVVSDIGMGRIAMNSAIVGEVVVFFPKWYTNLEGDESKLDRSRVKGL